MILGDEPIGWGYVRAPLYYPHAYDQWKRRLNALAEAEGYTISRWFGDVSFERFALETMLSTLPGGVGALFVPDVNHFTLPTAAITDYDDNPLYEYVRPCVGLTQAQLSIHLMRPVFMLATDGGASVAPVGDPRVRIDRSVPTPPPRRRHRRRLARLLRASS